jgi:recombination protein RecA
MNFNRKKTMSAAKKKSSKASALVHEINTTLQLERGVRLGSDEYFRIKRIPTGSLVLDRITGGGFALGRHYELFGDESSGKSYITYRTMALSQRRGNLCAIVDPEHSFDFERFDFLGGVSDELLAFHPRTAEDGVSVMMLLAQHATDHQLEVITIDSVSSLVAREELARDPREEDRIAAQARMMSRALRRLTTVNEKLLMLWTNQERVNVGVKFGNPNTTSGGKALRFYATGRIEFRKAGKIRDKRPVVRSGKFVEAEVNVARWISMRVEKDKSTRPEREGSFVFDYDLKTIDPAWEIISLGLEDGLIERTANGWYSYIDLDDVEYRGTEKKFRNMLMTNPQLFGELSSAIEDTTQNQFSE